MSHKILLLAGDGIGPEIVGAAEQVLQALKERHGLACEFEHALMGGCAIDAHGDSLPEATLAAARAADAILLGAVGGPKWDKVERAIRECIERYEPRVRRVQVETLPNEGNPLQLRFQVLAILDLGRDTTQTTIDLLLNDKRYQCLN